MLDEEIKFITADGDSARWQNIVLDGVHRWINYPRDVLRFSNALKFAWPALKGEFDSQDLVAIEGIRLFDPIAFDWIRRNRDFLFSEGRYIMGADEDRKANIEGLKASLPPATVDPFMELLTVLFPNHGKWFKGDRYMIRENHVASQARRGLASEAGYDSYFALRPSADAVPKSTIDAVFENLNDEKKLRNALRTYLGKNNSRRRAMIGLFLQDLRIRFAVQPRPQPTQELLNALVAIGLRCLGAARCSRSSRAERSVSWCAISSRRGAKRKLVSTSSLRTSSRTPRSFLPTYMSIVVESSAYSRVTVLVEK
jgi:hypothetical protein